MATEPEQSQPTPIRHFAFKEPPNLEKPAAQCRNHLPYHDLQISPNRHFNRIKHPRQHPTLRRNHRRTNSFRQHAPNFPKLPPARCPEQFTFHPTFTIVPQPQPVVHQHLTDSRPQPISPPPRPKRPKTRHNQLGRIDTIKQDNQTDGNADYTYL